MNSKTKLSLSIVTAALMLMTTIQALAGDGNGAETEAVETDSSKTLDANETAHLTFMREEEKLARDVYITLGMRFPDYIVFGNIDDSEQRHTCAVCDKLEAYGVVDPNTNDNVGVFTGEDYGPYFTEKYTELTEKGSISALDALLVGALIEELDMDDILYCPKEIIDQDNGMDSKSDCGSIYTDNPDIHRLYTSLLEGSKDHLRAFVKNIETIQGDGTYQAQYITQEQVDEILGR